MKDSKKGDVMDKQTGNDVAAKLNIDKEALFNLIEKGKIWSCETDEGYVVDSEHIQQYLLDETATTFVRMWEEIFERPVN